MLLRGLFIVTRVGCAIIEIIDNAPPCPKLIDVLASKDWSQKTNVSQNQQGI